MHPKVSAMHPKASHKGGQKSNRHNGRKLAPNAILEFVRSQMEEIYNFEVSKNLNLILPLP